MKRFYNSAAAGNFFLFFFWECCLFQSCVISLVGRFCPISGLKDISIPSLQFLSSSCLLVACFSHLLHIPLHSFKGFSPPFQPYSSCLSLSKYSSPHISLPLYFFPSLIVLLFVFTLSTSSPVTLGKSQCDTWQDACYQPESFNLGVVEGQFPYSVRQPVALRRPFPFSVGITVIIAPCQCHTDLIHIEFNRGQLDCS